MNLLELNVRSVDPGDEKLSAEGSKLSDLLKVLADRDGTEEVEEGINAEVAAVNESAASPRELRVALGRARRRILQLVEKQLRLVPRDYYRTLWISLGMSAFGIPIGAGIGAALGNMAFLAIGLPIGLAIGIAVGSQMDAKAVEEGRQLDIDA